MYVIHEAIDKLTPFSHGGRQKLQNATCYDSYILLSPIIICICVMYVEHKKIYIQLHPVRLEADPTIVKRTARLAQWLRARPQHCVAA